MRKIVSFLPVLAVLFAISAPGVSAAEGGKVGVINMQRIMMESSEGKKAKAAFMRELESKKARVASEEKSVKALEDELKAGAAGMKADQRKAKEERLANQVKELRRMMQDMDEELKKKDAELTSGIVKDALEAARKVAREEGYSLVMQAGPQIVYLDKANDITEQVLKRYESGR